MVNFNIRLPNELHARLKQAAAKERRSIHAEILWLIERGLNEETVPGLAADPGPTPP